MNLCSDVLIDKYIKGEILILVCNKLTSSYVNVAKIYHEYNKFKTGVGELGWLRLRGAL
jgi:hypothetical protein